MPAVSVVAVGEAEGGFEEACFTNSNPTGAKRLQIPVFTGMTGAVLRIEGGFVKPIRLCETGS